MRKLKTKEIKPTRDAMLANQLGICPICKHQIAASKDRLDHDHTTGLVRAVLCDGCNRLLGKIESNYKRFCCDLAAFLAGVGEYVSLHSTDQTGLIHPTHRSPDEKAKLTKARAKRKAISRKLAKLDLQK